MVYSNHKNTVLLYALLFLQPAIIHLVHAQEGKQHQIIEDIIEEIASTTGEELDYSSIYEELQYYNEYPLNINTAKEEELKRLLILTDFQIQSLLKYIEKKGPLLSIFELQFVYGFSTEIIVKLAPFITTKGESKEKMDNPFKKIQQGRHQIFMRYSRIIEEQQGYKKISDSALMENPNINRYLGSPAKLYTRYNYRLQNKLYWGFVAEKDRGEEFFRGSNTSGFDFYSFHFQANDLGIFKTIAVGDYLANFGQGLVSWSGLSFGKNANVLNINKHENKIRRYTSSNENNYMKGIATTIQVKDFDITSFFSSKKVDAHMLPSDSITHANTYTSLIHTGMHATPGEIENEKRIRENVLGGNVTFNRSNYKLGLTYMHINWEGYYLKNKKIYNQFYLNGTSTHNFGLNYQLYLSTIQLFGEIAMNDSRGIANLNGFLFNIIPRLSMSLIYRYYEKNYYAYYGNAFSEGSAINNESGIYCGLHLQLHDKLSLKGYYDRFYFPWLKYHVDAPSEGFEYQIQLDYNASEKVYMYARYKYKEKMQNANDNSPMQSIQNVELRKIRYHITYAILPSLSLSNRIEIADYKDVDRSHSTGYLMYQDASYHPDNFPLSVSLRYCLFDSEDYDSRIYAYENSVLYYYSIPSFYGEGSRSYIRLVYKMNKNISLWAWCARTYFWNQSSIGNGLSTIEDNTKTDIIVQCRITF